MQIFGGGSVVSQSLTYIHIRLLCSCQNATHYKQIEIHAVSKDVQIKSIYFATHKHNSQNSVIKQDIHIMCDGYPENNLRMGQRWANRIFTVGPLLAANVGPL